MLPTDIEDLAQTVVSTYKAKKLKIVTAESCTGGLMAAALTSVPGASSVFERGFVSYSNDSKVEVLGVLPDCLTMYGAVSREVAESMAQGALEYSRADVAIAVTGIAGPDGGATDKPVGLVFLGIASRSGALFHYQCIFKGSRRTIQYETTHEALRLLMSFVAEAPDSVL